MRCDVVILAVEQHQVCLYGDPKVGLPSCTINPDHPDVLWATQIHHHFNGNHRLLIRPIENAVTILNRHPLSPINSLLILAQWYWGTDPLGRWYELHNLPREKMESEVWVGIQRLTSGYYRSLKSEILR